MIVGRAQVDMPPTPSHDSTRSYITRLRLAAQILSMVASVAGGAIKRDKRNHMFAFAQRAGHVANNADTHTLYNSLIIFRNSSKRPIGRKMSRAVWGQYSEQLGDSIERRIGICSGDARI